MMNAHLRLGRALKLFDNFIRDWVTIESHAHLLDNDNNAAERVRQAIRDASASLSLAGGRSLAFVLDYPDKCSTEVSRKGESQPCDKTAYAVAVDDEIGATWPVCIHHARGRQLLSLAEILAAR